MKTRLLTSLATAALFAGPALAADLAPMPMPVKALAPVCYWCGAYVGAKIGGAWGTTDVSLAPSGQWLQDPSDAILLGSAGSHTFKRSSFEGGVEAGINDQWGSMVYGLEADMDWMNLSVSRSVGPLPGTIAFPANAKDAIFVTDSVDTHWIATFRPRIGFAAGNGFMIFATGGLAFGQQNFAQSYIVTGTIPTVPTPTPFTATAGGSTDRFAAGWTAGGGVEWRFAAMSPWSVKADYLHVDLGNVGFRTHLTTPFEGFEARDDSRVKADIVRVGINYRLWTR